MLPTWLHLRKCYIAYISDQLSYNSLLLLDSELAGINANLQAKFLPIWGQRGLNWESSLISSLRVKNCELSEVLCGSACVCVCVRGGEAERESYYTSAWQQGEEEERGAMCFLSTRHSPPWAPTGWRSCAPLLLLLPLLLLACQPTDIKFTLCGVLVLCF